MIKRLRWLAAGALALGLTTPALAACPTLPGNLSTTATASVQLSVLGEICANTTTASTNTAAGISYTDASISSATGSSQTVATASAGRRALIISNPAATTWWISPSGGTASAACAGCFELPPGSYWSPKPVPTNAVTGIGTSTSKLTVVGG